MTTSISKTILSLALVGGALSLAEICAEEAKPAADNASPFKSPPPTSAFRDNESGRDPFSPIGYKKPPPKGSVIVEKPPVNIKLDITGISVFQNEISATLSNGQIIEVGQTYQYIVSDKDKITVEYKVISISDDGVIISYDGKTQKQGLKGSELDIFKEKEAP